MSTTQIRTINGERLAATGDVLTVEVGPVALFFQVTRDTEKTIWLRPVATARALTEDGRLARTPVLGDWDGPEFRRAKRRPTDQSGYYPLHQWGGAPAEYNDPTRW